MRALDNAFSLNGSPERRLLKRTPETRAAEKKRLRNRETNAVGLLWGFSQAFAPGLKREDVWLLAPFMGLSALGVAEADARSQLKRACRISPLANPGVNAWDTEKGFGSLLGRKADAS